MAKASRRGKVFVDWSQNHQKKTTIAVYSLRARERPTASTPAALERGRARGRSAATPSTSRFEIPEAIKRVDKDGDLFEPVLKLRQKLPKLPRGPRSRRRSDVQPISGGQCDLGGRPALGRSRRPGRRPWSPAC